MLQTVSPTALALTAQRLRDRCQLLAARGLGDAVKAVIQDDLAQIAQRAQLMHCPSATAVQMLDASVALMEARMTLERIA